MTDEILKQLSNLIGDLNLVADRSREGQPTLRDRFAMSAPFLCSVSDSTSRASMRVLATLAYEWADAMMAARETK
jgi:hypothetical protein